MHSQTATCHLLCRLLRYTRQFCPHHWPRPHSLNSPRMEGWARSALPNRPARAQTLLTPSLAVGRLLQLIASLSRMLGLSHTTLRLEASSWSCLVLSLCSIGSSTLLGAMTRMLMSGQESSMRRELCAGGAIGSLLIRAGLRGRVRPGTLLQHVCRIIIGLVSSLRLRYRRNGKPRRGTEHCLGICIRLMCDGITVSRRLLSRGDK